MLSWNSSVIMQGFLPNPRFPLQFRPPYRPTTGVREIGDFDQPGFVSRRKPRHKRTRHIGADSAVIGPGEVNLRH